MKTNDNNNDNEKNSNIADDDKNKSESISEVDKVVNKLLDESEKKSDKKACENKSDKSDKPIGNLPVEQQLPNKLFLIPLSGRPIFPGIFTPLMINNTDDTKVVEQAYEGDGYVGIVMLKNDTETPSVDDMYTVGTVARIIKKINLPDGEIGRASCRERV